MFIIADNLDFNHPNHKKAILTAFANYYVC